MKNLPKLIISVVGCELVGLAGVPFTAAAKIFLAQLALNFLWSPLFFGLRSPILGLIDILAMWILIVITIRRFYPLSKPASCLLLPYLFWVTFAAALNAAIVVLN